MRNIAIFLHHLGFRLWVQTNSQIIYFYWM